MAKPRRATAADIEIIAPPGPNRLMSTRLVAGDAPGRRRVPVNLAESPLAWLTRRGMVTARQFDAGERLRDDFARAATMPSVTMRWDGAPSGSGARGAPPAADPSASRLQARLRFDAAVAAAGPGLGDVLWRVVCMGEGLETAERALGWPTRAGKLVLCLALDRVAAFYRL